MFCGKGEIIIIKCFYLYNRYILEMFFNRKNISKILLLFATATPWVLPMQSTQASDLTLSDVGNLMQRPKWLPELPKIETSGFAPDTAIYLALRKRIVNQRDKTAIPELHKLAKRGHAKSIVLMGYLYDQEPKLIPTNSTYAGQYWAVAAKAGDPVAMYNLGILYLNGRGVPRNLQTAQQLFTLASQQSLYRASYVLGQMYEAKKDWSQAINTYAQCHAAQYIPQCKTRHSILSITKTKLLPSDAKKAVDLLVEASSAGDLEATYTMARLSAEGIVINRSRVAMVYYLEMLVKSPNTNTYYRNLASKMYQAYRPTDEEIKQGKDNYRVANAGGFSNSKLASFKVVDLSKTILEAGSNLE